MEEAKIKNLRVKGQVKRKQSIVGILLWINLGVFLLQMMLPSINKYFVLTSQNALLQPWRLVTHMFMHASFSHIFFNMYALMLFGPLIEKRIGRKRFIWFYLIAGIIAGLAFIGFDHLKYFLGWDNVYGSAVGASGAIMGVIGLVIMLLPQMKVLFFFVIPMSMRTAGFIFAAIDIIGMFNLNSSVANIAHLAGLACGLLYGSYLIKQKKKYQEKFTNKPKYTSKVHKSTDPNNVVIELSEEDINEYLKNGNL